jgi:hypothetical protein
MTPMRQALRLALLLALFVRGFALLGALAAYDNGERTPWLGFGAGAAVGVLFGCVFGGDRKWRIWDYLFGPEEAGEGQDEMP